MAGHAQLKFVMTECSKTQIRLTRPKWHCKKGHVIQWNSSSVLGLQYTINYRMITAYLCSGMSQFQYERFSEFSNTGTLKSHFMSQTKKISNDQEPIQSDPTFCPQNQKGNN